MSLNLEASCLIEEYESSTLKLKKSVRLKKAFLSLVKDDNSHMILRVKPLMNSTLKNSFGYKLTKYELFKKFLNEGKATVNFIEYNVKLFIGDCAPDKLRYFLYNLKHKEKIARAQPKLKCENETPVNSLSFMEDCSPIANRVKPSSSKSSKKTSDYTFNHLFGESSDLNKIQENHLFEMIRKRKNVFCTGGAGSGKTFILKKIIRTLSPIETAITASTGVAATIIGGTTIHNFFGVSKLLEDDEENEEVWQRRALATISSQKNQSLKRIKTLIIDEISMISGRIFNRLDFIARCKKDEMKKAFGGLQLIVFGDFFQLPPVCPKGAKVNYAFESNSWQVCSFNCIELKKNWRQSDDAKFAELLNSIRFGDCPEWIQIELNNNQSQALRKRGNCSGVLPIRLCTHRSDADSWNETQLNKLPEEAKVFLANDSETAAKRTLDNLTSTQFSIRLKIGAWVMLTKNLNQNEGLVNGARGKVIRFLPKSDGSFPVVEFQIHSKNCSNKILTKEHTISPETFNCTSTNGNILTRTQLPLQLAWAISIHKSQGITLDSAEISLAKVFEYGQAYVALSRCRSLESLFLLDWNASNIKAHPAVKRFYHMIGSQKFRNN